MTSKPFHFEQALKELEDITSWFESTDVDLDQGLVKFERGMELAGELKAHLADIENRVEKIKSKFSAAPSAETSAAVEPSEPDDEDMTDSEQTGLFRS